LRCGAETEQGQDGGESGGEFHMVYRSDTSVTKYFMAVECRMRFISAEFSD